MNQSTDVTHPEKCSAERGGEPVPALMAKNLRILLLEDVATDAELIQRELTKADISFCSHCVETREDFLRALEDFSPDAILADFSMPQFNAMEALQLLRDQPRDIPFILVTGSQSEEVAV